MASSEYKITAETYTITQDRIIDPYQTTNAVYQTVLSIPVQTNQILSIEVEAIATTPTFNQAVAATVTAMFLRGSGNVTRTSTSASTGLIQTIFTTLGLLSTVDLTVVPNTGTQTADIQVRGQASTTLNWNFVIRMKYTN